MTKIEELREKANRLPLLPGVYIMLDASGEVIYVGKAKALKNRVTSYFRGEHLPKVAAMVSHVNDFNVIIAETEFEALVLENSLIKRHKPHYNILLKDDKGYPFLRIPTDEPYPTFQVVGKPKADAAHYLGPYAGRGAAMQAIDTVNRALGLRDCHRSLPRDIGKRRPCLNAQMGLCCAPCAGKVSQQDYAQRVAQAIRVLEGDYEALAAQLERDMLQAAEQERFEQAAQLRDRMRAIQRAGQHQMVVASGFSDMDILAFVQGETKGCLVVLHYIAGNLYDKEYTMLDGTAEQDGAELLGDYLKQYYAMRGVVPGLVLISHPIEELDAVSEFLRSIAGKKVTLSVPQRGRRRELMDLARKNAREEIVRSETTGQRRQKSLELFGSMMGLPQMPTTFEAYDISNLAGTNTVGSMIVFENGQPKRSRYRRFRIESVADGQDDYKAMEEMLTRRLQRWKDGDEKFSPLPSVFMIDGGLGHVRIAKGVLERFGCETPVFGMVKDDHHRTRGLVAPDGREFSIATTPAVFALVGRMQEEVHRFAITYQRTLRQSQAVRSQLDRIPGIGEKRRTALLQTFKSLKRVREATIEELEAAVPHTAAQAVYDYFHSKQEEQT